MQCVVSMAVCAFELILAFPMRPRCCLGTVRQRLMGYDIVESAKGPVCDLQERKR